MGWAEVSAPVPVQAALAPASQAPGLGLALVQQAERLPALVPGPVLAQARALEQASVPGLASARARAPVPGFQPLAARPWELRPFART
jgi:hypothetical protein